MNRLVVASTNAGKVREVRLALADAGDWYVEALPEDLPEVEENGSDFIENAKIKAVHYSAFRAELVVADDSGLCVNALNGRPGLQSARYGTSAEDRNQRLLRELAAAGTPDRHAAFYCALAVARMGRVLWTVETRLDGEITEEPAGEGGFGYDPIFRIPELGKTLAELTPDEKNRISARGKALLKLRAFLDQM